MARWSRYFKDKRVWVTGASSGIGRAIAQALAAHNVTTLVSARRADLLEQLSDAHDCVTALPVDITDQASLTAAVTRAWDLLGQVDVVIHAAGISQRSLFVESDPAALRRVIEVDLFGTLELTRVVLPRMIAQGSGHIAAITSVTGKLGAPLRSAQAAAKHGVHGLFDSLRGELAGTTILLSLVKPGNVQTELSLHAVRADGGEYGHTDPGIASGATPERCAELILRKLARRRREFYVALTPIVILGLVLRRVAPGLLWRMMGRVKTT